MYRVIVQYLPDAAVCRVARKPGAWRVVSSMEATAASAPLLKPVLLITLDNHGGEKLLVLSSPRKRQAHSWCNPRRILEEWLAHRRAEREKDPAYFPILINTVDRLPVELKVAA